MTHRTPFTARKTGVCCHCAQPIVPGQQITATATRGAFTHADCADGAAAPQKPAVHDENLMTDAVQAACAARWPQDRTERSAMQEFTAREELLPMTIAMLDILDQRPDAPLEDLVEIACQHAWEAHRKVYAEMTESPVHTIETWEQISALADTSALRDIWRPVALAVRRTHELYRQPPVTNDTTHNA